MKNHRRIAQSMFLLILAPGGMAWATNSTATPLALPAPCNAEGHPQVLVWADYVLWSRDFELSIIAAPEGTSGETKTTSDSSRTGANSVCDLTQLKVQINGQPIEMTVGEGSLDFQFRLAAESAPLTLTLQSGDKTDTFVLPTQRRLEIVNLKPQEVISRQQGARLKFAGDPMGETENFGCDLISSNRASNVCYSNNISEPCSLDEPKLAPFDDGEATLICHRDTFERDDSRPLVRALSLTNFSYFSPLIISAE